MSDIAERSNTAPRTLRTPDTRHAKRAAFLKWLRKTHGWVGLWAMALTILFGVTGVLQNHRVSLKAETPKPSTVRVALPSPEVASTPDALAAFLRAQLGLDRAPDRIRREPARPMPWGERSMMQPERWEIRFAAPHYIVTAEYWKGENAVEVKRQQRGPVGTLEGLHKALGTSLAWALLSDSVAVGLVFLSLTGLLLWLKLERRRAIGTAVLLLSVAAAIALAVASL